MSELLTQSRPYAEAIFEIAKEENTLDLWVLHINQDILRLDLKKIMAYLHIHRS